jgi:hypothetical protein
MGRYRHAIYPAILTPAKVETVPEKPDCKGIPSRTGGYSCATYIDLMVKSKSRRKSSLPVTRLARNAPFARKQEPKKKTGNSKSCLSHPSLITNR